MEATLTTIDETVHEAVMKITAPTVHPFMEQWITNGRQPTEDMLTDTVALTWAFQSLWEIATEAHELATKVLEAIIEEGE